MQHIALVSLEGCWHYKKEINFHHSATEDNPLLLGRPNFHQRSTKVKGFFYNFCRSGSPTKVTENNEK
jgi:hypothetical protein